MQNFPALPDYFILRVAADLSSAMRGQTVGFNYGAEGLAITGPAPASSPPPAVSVTTPLLASARPMVQTATIEVEGYGSCALPSDTCSALLWSESAVEKFLLPYYVSAGGPKAHEVLHAINHAWYDYQDATPVVALAFGYPSVPLTTSSVQLWDTVSVVYCQPAADPTAGSPGSLAVQPLREFLASQLPPPAPETPEDVSFSWGPATVGTVPTGIDSVGAREVAEYVSGFRGQDVYVYATGDGGGLDPTLASDGDGEPLFTAWTRFVRPRRPQVTMVTLTYTETRDGTTITKTRELTAIGGQAANMPDSAFWTDAAVELLVTPYYASVQGFGAPWYLALILGKWSGIIPTSLVGALELLEQILRMLGRLLLEKPASVVDAAVRRLEGEAEETGPFTSEVFALIHLPNSEYVDQTDQTVWNSILLENRTWLLTSTGDHPLVSPRRRLVPRRRLTA